MRKITAESLLSWNLGFVLMAAGPLRAGCSSWRGRGHTREVFCSKTHITELEIVIDYVLSEWTGDEDDEKV
jgi:hypothetical protein